MYYFQIFHIDVENLESILDIFVSVNVHIFKKYI